MTYDPATRRERRRLTHLDRTGRPRMVDVGSKPVTARRAVGEALVTMTPETLSLIIDGANPKGDVLSVAEYDHGTAAEYHRVVVMRGG